MFTNKIKTAAMAAITLAICVSGIVSQDASRKYYVDDYSVATYDDSANSIHLFTVGDFECCLGSEGVVIYEYKGKATKVEIPATIKGLPVTEIGDGAFYGCSGLTSVTIPEGVTYIGQSAFSYCDALTSIKIPASVQEIEYSAFENCKSLTAVEFGSEETVVYSSTFSGCDSLSPKARAVIQKHQK